MGPAEKLLNLRPIKLLNEKININDPNPFHKQFKNASFNYLNPKNTSHTTLLRLVTLNYGYKNHDPDNEDRTSYLKESRIINNSFMIPLSMTLSDNYGNILDECVDKCNNIYKDPYKCDVILRNSKNNLTKSETKFNEEKESSGKQIKSTPPSRDFKVIFIADDYGGIIAFDAIKRHRKLLNNFQNNPRSARLGDTQYENKLFNFEIDKMVLVWAELTLYLIQLKVIFKKRHGENSTCFFSFIAWQFSR